MDSTDMAGIVMASDWPSRSRPFSSSDFWFWMTSAPVRRDVPSKLPRIVTASLVLSCFISGSVRRRVRVIRAAGSMPEPGGRTRPGSPLVAQRLGLPAAFLELIRLLHAFPDALVHL